MTRSGTQVAMGVSGLFLVIASIVFTSQWYFELPLPADISRFPVTGITLFKTALLLEGLLLLLFAAMGWQFKPVPVTQRLQPNLASQADLSALVIRAMILILGMAIILRSIGLSQSLWIDEVNTIGYAASSLIEQLTVFINPNNHVLNTLLIQLSIHLFGESEWSVRLPAVMFGAATIPVLFWVTRQRLGDWPAVAVSLLLAVSYHHIFFSQNARGYSAYLFLSLFATGLFLKALRQDQFRLWMLYILVMFLDFSALMNSVFVALAHVITGLFALYFLKRQGAGIWPLTRRLFFVFLILGLMVFQFYAIEIPQIYTVLSELYSNQAAGFSFFSLEFLQEMVRGVSAGFGAGAVIAVVPFAAVAAAGLSSFLKKDILLAMLLIWPGIITAVYLVAKGLTVSPRFFLFELFFALICAVSGIISSSAWLGAKLGLEERLTTRISVAVVILLAGLSVVSLQGYYNTPKQPYRAAVDYVEQRKTGATEVIVVSTAQSGIAYYRAKKRAAETTDDYSYIRDVVTFKTRLRQLENQPVLIITTFHRALGINLPTILDELEEHWQIATTFPATIGDGEITVWERQ